MPQYSKPLLLDMGGWIFFDTSMLPKLWALKEKKEKKERKERKKEEKGRCRQREKNEEREKKSLGLQTRIQMNHFIESSQKPRNTSPSSSPGKVVVLCKHTGHNHLTHQERGES